MNRDLRRNRRPVAFALAFALAGLTLAFSGDAQQPALPEGPACDAWNIEYALSANLRLSDTPLGQGDGIYPIGPGRVVLRFENRAGTPAGSVKLLSYDMREHFTIKSRTLFWSTVVETDTKTRVTPDRCGVAASGSLVDTSLRWGSKLAGYRTDGTLTCTGALCGKFGAPPAGKSEFHVAPHPVAFSPFVFEKDLKHFKMAETFVSKTATPKQSAHIALSGTELKRSCVMVKPCQ
jgi:hypothetical protein